MSAEQPGLVHARMGEIGRSWWGPGDMYTFLVTGAESAGLMFALDCLVGVGGGPPPHRHMREEELFTITAGSVRFFANGETKVLAAAESIFVPRGVTHAYTNDGPDAARMIAVYTPAGMEGWFAEVYSPVREAGETPPPVTDELLQRMADAGARFGIEWVS